MFLSIFGEGRYAKLRGARIASENIISHCQERIWVKLLAANASLFHVLTQDMSRQCFGVLLPPGGQK